jgi:hypothetical protein
MKTLLWLDDKRNPFENDWLKFSPIQEPFTTVWVKSYKEFVNHIVINGLPDAICFDHDLGLPNHIERINNGMSKRSSRKLKQQEKTGYDCAKWLVELCMDNHLKLPLYNIQSSNPVGKDNIDSLLKNFIKHCHYED